MDNNYDVLQIQYVIITKMYKIPENTEVSLSLAQY